MLLVNEALPPHHLWTSHPHKPIPPLFYLSQLKRRFLPLAVRTDLSDQSPGLCAVVWGPSEQVPPMGASGTILNFS